MRTGYDFTNGIVQDKISGLGTGCIIDGDNREIFGCMTDDCGLGGGRRDIVQDDVLGLNFFCICEAGEWLRSGL